MPIVHDSYAIAAGTAVIDEVALVDVLANGHYLPRWARCFSRRAAQAGSPTTAHAAFRTLEASDADAPRDRHRTRDRRFIVVRMTEALKLFGRFAVVAVAPAGVKAGCPG
jgi:hypothetical protein